MPQDVSLNMPDTALYHRLVLYVVAFVATVLDHTSDMRYWKAAVAATIIIPVLIWAYSFVYRLLKGSDDKESDDVTKKP